MNNDLLYQLALTRVPHIGAVNGKALVQAYGQAAAVFQAPKHQLEKIEGVGTVRAESIKSFKGFDDCEKEIAFIERYNIKPIFINDPAYPRRLLNCYDNPLLLFYRGNADLNASRIVSVVGTRNYSEYGRHCCETMIAELKDKDVVIVSGLAFGIDTIAHKNALKNNIPTIGVLAHGLDRIYPPENKALAKQMTGLGGLLTDFGIGSNPDKQNFPRRNRIVAGLCDCLLVIESGKKGGSLITAELANSYNKDVFALPGRVTDSKSEGCNWLVRSNKACLVSSTEDLLQFMNWNENNKQQKKLQRELFVDLTDNEQLLLSLLTEQETMHIDELYLKSCLSSSSVAAALLILEMKGLIASLPGKIYKIL